MKRVITALVAVLVVFAFSCASWRGSPVVTELTETIHEACDFYEDARPVVLEYRQWAKDNWDVTVVTDDGQTIPLISPRQKKLLAELDTYLPKLDGFGSDVCLASETIATARASPPRVNWDNVLSTLMKVASTAIQLKADGAF